MIDIVVLFKPSCSVGVTDVFHIVGSSVVVTCYFVEYFILVRANISLFM